MSQDSGRYARDVLRLPEPMLAKSGPIPTSDGWVFEPKMDGFRCLLCTHGGRFRARSRRGWDMSGRLPELAQALPVDVQPDARTSRFTSALQAE